MTTRGYLLMDCPACNVKSSFMLLHGAKRHHIGSGVTELFRVKCTCGIEQAYEVHASTWHDGLMVRHDSCGLWRRVWRRRRR